MVSQNPQEISEQVEGLSSEKFYWAFLAIFFLVGIGFRVWVTQDPLINEWVTRDIDRAFKLIEGVYFPLSGPEVNTGGRLPGPFLYILLAIPLLFSPSYEAVFWFNFLLNVSSIVILFLTIRRHYGLISGVIAGVLFSIYLPYIQPLALPINPAFLLLFLALFIYFLLEFVLNKDDRFLPLMVLVVALGVQIHYSIALYILPLLLLIWLFKIRIRLKFIFISILILGIVFTPYMVYKLSFFQGIDEGNPRTFWYKEFDFLSLLEIPLIWQTFYGIVFKNGITRYLWFPFPVATIYFTLFLCSLVYLFARTIKKFKKDGINNCKKELIFLALFYLPAVVYEILNPFEKSDPHIWYSYVLIVPQLILVGVAFGFIWNHIQLKSTRICLNAIAFALAVFLTCDATWGINYFDTSTRHNLLDIGIRSNKWNFSARKYIRNKSMDQYLGFLMTRLDLTPQEYYERVYFEGFSPQSLKKLELVAEKIKKNKSTVSEETSEKPCFYIKHRFYTGSYEHYRLSLLEKDLSIDHRLPLRFVKERGIQPNFIVHRYFPKVKQSCYNNSFNYSVVDENIRNVQQLGGNLDFGKDWDVNVHSVQQKYGDESRLVSFEGEYLIYSHYLKTPFKLNLTIRRVNDKYVL